MVFHYCFFLSNFLSGSQASLCQEMRSFDSSEASSIWRDNSKDERKIFGLSASEEEDATISGRGYDLEGWMTEEEIIAGLKEPTEEEAAKERRRQSQLPLPRDGTYRWHIEFCRPSLKVPALVVTIRPTVSHSFQEIKLVRSYHEVSPNLAELSEVTDAIYLYIKGLKERITYLEKEVHVFHKSNNNKHYCRNA